ncbi:MAG: hypothetical protein ACK6A5_13555, partial [Flavobacteriales bacterium]
MRILSLLALVVLLTTGCRRDELQNATSVQGPVLHENSTVLPAPAGDPLSQEDLDRLVISTLEQRNDFHWEWMELHTLWSAVQYNDHSLAIGYQPVGAGNVDDALHTINIREGAWRAVHDALIDRILAELNKERTAAPLTLADILVEDDPVLPILTLRITDKNVITMLRNLRNVRYLEPLDYFPTAGRDERSTSGCSASTYAL